MSPGRTMKVTVATSPGRTMKIAVASPERTMKNTVAR